MTNPEEGIALSRRSVVSGLGGVGLAGLFAASNSAEAYGGGTATSGIFDVTKAPYNAPTDGVHDAQPGIQAAITAAQANGGGIVLLPPGVYKLNAGLVISQQITLCGAGWSTPSPDSLGSPTNSTGNGTWLSINSTAFTPIQITGSGVIVRDIAFIHQQATTITSSWVPVNYPYTIDVNKEDALIENIFLRNATRGIAVRGAGGQSVGRATLNHIWGQPIIEGILVDNALDVIKINDVHFWGFWSFCQVVMDYMRYGDCRGITFKRADIPYISNVFVINYRRGFYFTTSPSPGVIGGITSAFLMTNCAADGCVTGIEADGAGTSGSIVGFYSLGGAGGIAGIITSANNIVLQCSNIRSRLYENSCVYADGNGTIVTLENVWFDSWNQANLGFPAIAAVNGANVMVGRSRIFTNAAGPQFLVAGSPVGTIVQDS